MNYFNLYWGAVLLLLPFWIRIESVPVDMRFAKDMFFISCVMVSLVLFKRKRKVGAIMTGILSYLVFMAYYNQWLITSFAVIYQWTCFAMGALCFVQFYSNLERRDEHFYLNVLSIMSIMQMVLVLFSHYQINLHFFIIKAFNWKANYHIGNESIKYLGSMGNQLVCSTLLSITSISLLRKKWFWILPLNLYAIYLTGSATGILGVAFGILTFGLLKHFKSKCKTFSILGVITALTGLLVLFKSKEIPFLKDNHRLNVWENAFELIELKHFVFGRGLGFISDNYSPRFPILGEAFRQLHNEYLDVFFAFGIVGVLILAFIIYLMLKRTNSTIIISIIITYLVTMLTGITLHISATALIGILLVALCLIQGENYGTNYSSSRS